MIKAKCAPCRFRGKPARRNALVNSSDHAIVARFGTVYRGIAQYNLLAGGVFRLHRLRWVMETSMVRPSRPSTAHLCRKWQPNTRPESTRPTSRGSASRPGSSGRTGSHWWLGSVGLPSSSSGQRRSLTVGLSGWITRRRS
ncbi:group II intron reverse transcriptase/maturase [Streptomyces netropsis]|uniref:group II intron reverse transcriptase/maturase n=1 Tax=Streptomyces netropsis TaxID=55404 RepID=UPI0037AC283A